MFERKSKSGAQIETRIRGRKMSRVLFFSDPHFSHEKMAINRGFSSVEEHDNHIIENWNKKVSKRDIVWLLGDITMEKRTPYPLLGKLNGLIRVVAGNHDRPQDTQELLKYVQSISGLVKYKGFALSHCPIHESEISRFRGNIHGHVHANSLPDHRYFNVSAENINYTPISFKELLEIREYKKQ
jgi:calcineurin-like phosphoesterase family protein